MPINHEKYKQRIKDLGIETECSDEIIAPLYSIMEEFITAALNKHPVQHALDEKSRNLLPPQAKSGTLNENAEGQ